MKRLKYFSLFQWLTSRVDLKVLFAIMLVAAIFIPFTTYISYRHAYDVVQKDAEQQVGRLVKIIENTAATAAYLNDKQLAWEIITGLKTAPVIASVRITLSSNESLNQGKPFESADRTFQLMSRFSDTPVGKIDVLLSRTEINEQARDEGLFLMGWQLSLLVTLLLCMLLIFKFFVVQRLRNLMTQVQQVEIESNMTEQVIQLSGNDELAYLANHTNQLIQKIHGLYIAETARNIQIAQLERQFRMIFENSHAGIALINSRNQVFLANSAFEKLLLDSREKSDEQYYLPELFSEPYELEDMLNQVRIGHKSEFKDFSLKRGKDIWVRVLFSLVEEQRGNRNRFIELVVYDISDRAKQEKVFAYNATHDALTGLLNRRGAELKFKEQLSYANRHNYQFILAMLDLNDFKPVNDHYGHEAGDVVLKVIASRLLGVLRADDTIVRWGGDEFVVGFVLEDLERLYIILDDIQRQFTIPIEISNDIKVNVGASIGVSLSSVEGYNLTALLESADATMYLVKNSDKRQYRVAEEPISEEYAKVE
ncbi:GGDEF domain-containing protein [Shewanella avicenniae]|uniref:GGDEF domain-containing protein n=1 Tax=Shewanella avicenniae TaxID=2814294 RepID=A0ABX7QU51_9GAMM|nr:sensor domain-containing diguanylate cyclase [Shewanella avicenniae]QSX34190.1 GGDEF domain-containing protein [Shewanella avicenniae]